MVSGPPVPLVALRAFVAVGESRSIREAARRLGVGHSVISRHVRTLEDWARCSLAVTGPGGVSLTEDGQHMFAAAAPAFAMLQAVAERHRPVSAIRPFEIWCVPGLATRWLGARLGALQAVLGDRRIELRPTDIVPDLARGEADAAIVYGVPDADSDIAQVELCRPPVFPVASPSWAALNAAPVAPAEFATLPLLHEHSDAQWRTWLGDEGTPLAGPRLWYASMALDAAEHGQGVALANTVLARDALAAGRLVAISARTIVMNPYILLTARRRRGDPAVQRLAGWLTTELAAYAASESHHPPGQAPPDAAPRQSPA